MDNYTPRYVGIIVEQENIAAGPYQDALYKTERVKEVLSISCRLLTAYEEKHKRLAEF